MKKDLKDKIVIRQWLEDELSQEELEQLKANEAYSDYKKIIDATNALGVPEYDAERLFSKVKERKQSIRKPIKKLTYWMYSSAAAILLFLGYFYFTNQSIIYTTNFGEQLLVMLPDSSKVQLNANSIIEFKKQNWKENRVLELTGEGYFEVVKGEKFIVKTKEGTVEVLGTKFNVIVQPDFFEVLCQEGKVKASNLVGESAILTQGMGFRVDDNQTQNLNFNGASPSWLEGESRFNNVPLKQVIKALQNQFGVNIINENIDKNQRYTGSFTNKNLKLALKTVFDAMEISYTFEDDHKIILFKSK